MDFQTIAALVFLFLLGCFVYFNRKRIILNKIAFPFLYTAMYRTRFGLRFMDSFPRRFPRLVSILGYAAIVVGMIGMLAISYVMVRSVIDLFLKPSAVPAVQPILPFNVKGAFFVPFFYFLITISLLAIIHEAMHGILARRYGVRIKASGFAFIGILLPIIPLAFVDVDEKALRRKRISQQLAMFASGAFINIAFAACILVLGSLLMLPISQHMVDFNGAKVVGFSANSSAQAAGIKEGDVFIRADGTRLDYVENLSRILSGKKPGDTLQLATAHASYAIPLGGNPKNSSVPYLGVSLQQSRTLKPEFDNIFGRALLWITGEPEFRYERWYYNAVLWLISPPSAPGLLYFMFILNFGVGLVNLLPMGPIDGGRMAQLILQRVLRKEKGNAVFKAISWVFLALILINVAFIFIK